jgi:putative transposase
MEVKKMAKKKHSDELKAKVILEVLKEEKTIAEISSQYGIHKCTIRDWKKQFLANMHLAVNPQKGLEKYKEKLRQEGKEKDELYKQIGKLTAQLDWAKKKSEELGLDY